MLKNETQLILFVSVITLLSSLFSYSQNARIPTEKLRQMHHETLGDPYHPNRYNNKKTSPAYKYESNPSSKQVNSTIFTIQVNVFETGDNLYGDAANEPNIAVDPFNKNIMVIGWRQFDDVNSNFRQAGWSYTTDSGQTWTFPGVIEPGVFRSDPVLDYDVYGNFYYNSLTNSPDFYCKVFKSSNGGVTWNNGSDAKGGDKQWMTVDRTSGTGAGNIYSCWNVNFSTCLPGFFTRSGDGGGSFEDCIPVDGNPYWGTMAVGNYGELYIAGGGDQPDSLLVAKSLNAETPLSVINWNLSESVFMDGFLNSYTINPEGLLGQVNIDVDRSNGPGRDNVYLLASLTRISNFDPGDVMFARSTDGGLTWSSPRRINDDASVSNTQWFGTMSVASNGRIDAVWLDTRDNPGIDSSALYYSYSTDQGNTWSVNEKLSASFNPHIGYPNQNKMGDYFDMVSDNFGAHLAWANTFNGEEDVYYSHIVPPVVNTVNEISNNASFSIFPNPTTGAITIMSEVKQYQIKICNAFGEEVYSKTSLKTMNEIDISSQPAGIYFLKVVNQNGSAAIKKIVKE